MKFKSDKQRKAVMANLSNGNTPNPIRPSPLSIAKQRNKIPKTRLLKITQDSFERINSDVYGNPRYVIHYTEIMHEADKEDMKKLGYDTWSSYNYAVEKGKLLGLRKYHNKAYGGGLSTQSYSLPSDAKYLNKKGSKTLSELRRDKKEMDKQRRLLKKQEVKKSDLQQAREQREMEFKTSNIPRTKTGEFRKDTFVASANKPYTPLDWD